MKRIIVSILVFCLIIAATACANSDSTQAGGFKATKDKTLSTYKEPDAASVVYSESFGNIPVNQMILVFADGTSKNAAEGVIKEVGGTVIGELEIINLYQVKTDFTTEAELTAALDIARAMDGVELAFVNSEIFLSGSEGTACSPMKDPVFSDPANAEHYKMIGMENAWRIIQGSGVALNNVSVGVLDTALYTGSDELAGKVKISGDETDEPAKNNNQIVKGGLSHGTMVSHVIGADGDNSGMVGIASILGDKLSVKVKNLFNGQPFYQDAELDEDDITQGVISDGTAHTLKALVYLKQQVDSGATVINCSFNCKPPNNIHEWEAKAFEKFFKAILKEKPGVMFVASAGNANAALNGKNDLMAGLALPNVVTVGAVNNDGSRAGFSCYGSDAGEVTLSAPGVDMLLGVDENGQPIKNDGTSFSAPQVTSAIALIQSINPKLGAEQIKELLTSTAAPGITTGDQSIPIPEGMGAGVLRVDEAVLKAINDMREDQDLEPYSMQQLLDISTVVLSANGGGSEFTLTAKIPAALGQSADVKIEVQGEHSLKGDSTQSVAAGGEATWDITLAAASVFIRVARLDNGGCAYMTLAKETGVAGIYAASGTSTVWEATDPIKDFEAKVEQDGASMKITFKNDSDTVLTGTYDEASKTFTGRDTRQSDDPFASTWWQWSDTVIQFNTDSSPTTGTGRLYVPAPEDALINSDIVVDFIMTKVD